MKYLTETYPREVAEFLSDYLPDENKPAATGDCACDQYNAFKYWLETYKDFEILVTDLDVEIKVSEVSEFVGTYADLNELHFGVVEESLTILST